MPSSPSAESVPAAPPSCTASPVSARSARRRRASSSATSQPAATRPNVVGTACCSSVRRGHRRRAVLAGERCARLRSGVGMAQHESDRVARDEHRRGVEHVLARCPEVDEALVLVADPGTEDAHERLGRVPDGAALVEQLVPAVAVRVCAGGGDRLGGGVGDEAHHRAGRRQRAFGLEHRQEPGPAGHRLAEIGRDEQRLECRHTAKNVVCDGPWRHMSNRRPPSSATATSVSRCSGRRRESTGSSAFASVSSGK